MPQIGSWDTSNLIFAVLPNALKAGTNPAAFNAGNFPMYFGESAGLNEAAILTNMLTGYGYATDGTIKTDGVNDYLNLQDNFVIGTRDFTIEMWIKIPVWQQWGRIFCYVGTVGWPTNRIELAVGQGTWITTVVQQDGSTLGYLNNIGDIFNSNFHHLVVSFDRSGNATSYVNGSYAADFDISMCVATNFGVSKQGTWIGQLADAGAGSYPEPFELAHLAVYDTVLTSGRIADNYALGISMGGIAGYVDNPGVDTELYFNLPSASTSSSLSSSLSESISSSMSESMSSSTSASASSSLSASSSSSLSQSVSESSSPSFSESSSPSSSESISTSQSESSSTSTSESRSSSISASQSVSSSTSLSTSPSAAPSEETICYHDSFISSEVESTDSFISSALDNTDSFTSSRTDTNDTFVSSEPRCNPWIVRI